MTTTVTPSSPTSTVGMQDDPGLWDYAVPLSDEHRKHASLTYDDFAADSLSSSDYTLKQSTNGHSHKSSLKRKSGHRESSQSSSSGSDTRDMRRSSNTSGLSGSFSRGLGKKDMRVGPSGVESDYAIDKYGQKIVRNGYVGKKVITDDEYDEEDWIHRDKLVKIESAELREAVRGGMLPLHISTGSHSSVSSISKNGRKRSVGDQLAHVRDASEQSASSSSKFRTRSQSRDHITRLGEGSNHADKRYRYRDDKKQSISSPQPGEDDQEESAQGSDDTTARSSSVQAQSMRAVSSKLPLPTSSAVPISQKHLERNTPLARRRVGSLTMSNENTIGYAKTRDRSHSVGSQILLDEIDTNSNVSTPLNRPDQKPNHSASGSKTKLAGKTTPNSGKKSAVPTPSKARTPSSNRNVSSTQRPRTSSGMHKPSPSQRQVTRPADKPSHPVNRPEGDPPWLANAFNPDPRLPPEEQIIPTHARMLQQERWEKEGKSGAAYDPHFSPIQVMDDQHRSPIPPLSLEPEQKEPAEAEGEEKPPRDTKVEEAVVSETVHTPRETYSPMPKLETPPKPKVIRVPESHQEEEKKAGCGCCIVM